jgi:hypothetical protein
MGFLVLPASIPDIRKVYDVYFAAFENEIITRILFPWDVKDEEFRKGHAAHTLDYLHMDNLQYTCKCIDTDTGDIVGMSLWDVHWRERTEPAAKPTVDWLQGAQKERAEGFIVPFWEKKEQVLGGRRHVCKSFLPFSTLDSSTDRSRLPRRSSPPEVSAEGYRSKIDSVGS